MLRQKETPAVVQEVIRYFNSAEDFPEYFDDFFGHDWTEIKTVEEGICERLGDEKAFTEILNVLLSLYLPSKVTVKENRNPEGLTFIIDENGQNLETSHSIRYSVLLSDVSDFSDEISEIHTAVKMSVGMGEGIFKVGNSFHWKKSNPLGPLPGKTSLVLNQILRARAWAIKAMGSNLSVALGRVSVL